MLERRHYKKAPITEAALDIRVRLGEGVDLEVLRKFQDAEADRYPIKRQMHRWHAEFKANVGPEASGPPVIASGGDSTAFGVTSQSADEAQVFQARLDGFTFSRLYPYQRWELLRDEARRLWSGYREHAKPRSIDRLALRYINRLDLPMPLDDFRRYLRTVPEVSSDLNQGLSGLLMQLQIPYPDVKAMLNLTEATVDPVVPETAAIILDIDLWRVEDVPDDDSALWECFEVLHTCENGIFEGCITDEARRLFT
jgi:uncharacterized protein (TIGR04255 family)